MTVIIQNAEIALGVREEFSWGDLAVDAAIGTVTSGASTIKNAGRIANITRKVATRADNAQDAASHARRGMSLCGQTRPLQRGRLTVDANERAVSRRRF